jgi:IS30 family transposase
MLHFGIEFSGGALYSELQHRNKTKGQLRLGKIVSESILTINLNSMPHTHFTPEQRNQLAILLRARIKKKKIAQLLGKDRTTVWRERRKVETNGKYYAGKAKRLAKEKRIKANQRFRKIKNDKALRKYVIEKLRHYWSPEQIAGRWNRNHKRKHINKDTVYKFIYQKRKDLVKYLRCQKGKYRRRYGTRIREKQREALKKRRIDQRPEIVSRKARIGDWEGDTIQGKDKNHILTHLERKSGLILADKLERTTAEAAKEKTIRRFKNIHRDKKHTMTYDNGSVFSEYELTERETGLCIYFARAYCSWQRGANENANGLLRQFFPKKTPFGPVSQSQIQKAVRLLNNRPRKRLNYLTPYEVFNEKSKCCTLE